MKLFQNEKQDQYTEEEELLAMLRHSLEDKQADIERLRGEVTLAGKQIYFVLLLSLKLIFNFFFLKKQTIGDKLKALRDERKALKENLTAARKEHQVSFLFVSS